MKNIFLLIPVLFILFFSYGCDEGTSIVNNGIYEDLDIGVLIPQTGSGSSTGASIEASLNIAVRDINEFLAANGYNLQVRLHIKDTQTDSITAMTRLEELNTAGIKVVIGPYSSSNLSHIKDYLDRNGILAISPSSVAISLAIPNDNIFRFVPNDLGQAQAITKYFTQDSKSYIIPIVRDDVWGNDLIGAVQSEFQALGGKFGNTLSYGTGLLNLDTLNAQLNREIDEALDTYPVSDIGVYLISFGEGTYILEAASVDTLQKGINWYGSSAFAENGSLLSSPSAAGFTVSHGFPCPVFGLNDSAQAVWQPLLTQLESQLNRKPESYAFAAYDALYVAALTYVENGGYDNIQTYKMEFYTQAEEYFGATGNTTLNDAGDRAAATYDFWEVTGTGSNYSWIRTAVYNTLTGEIHQP